ncbi:hypothetical protein NQZ68_014065 [Dissostichus eleginoides]|nr:hypothetical protein NQZ68_014065 [Dissostichus eleginoides]
MLDNWSEPIGWARTKWVCPGSTGFDVVGGGSSGAEGPARLVVPRPLASIHQGVPASGHAKGFHILGKFILSLTQVQEYEKQPSNCFIL